MRKFSWMLNVFFSFGNRIFTAPFYRSIQSSHPSSGPHLWLWCKKGQALAQKVALWGAELFQWNISGTTCPYGYIHNTVKKILGLIPYNKNHLSVWKWMDYLIETHETIFHLAPECCSLEHLYTLFHCMMWTSHKAPKCCRYTGVTEFTKPDCEVFLTIGRFTEMLVVQAKIL